MKTATETFPHIAEELERNPAVLGSVLNKRNLLNILMAPYKIKLNYKKAGFAYAGRDSLNSLTKAVNYDGMPEGGLLLDVGNFTQVALVITILTGGEHRNNKVLNHTMSHWVDVKSILAKNGITLDGDYSKGTVNIGSNVIISTDAIILSGITIGDGAVIGAGAVVTKNIPPFAIAAGNPARVIKYRFAEDVIEDLLQIRWWDFSVPFFLNNLQNIGNMDKKEIREQFLNIDESAYDTTKNYLVFETIDESSNEHIIFSGAEINGKFIANNDLPELFQFFMLQLYNGEGDTSYLIKDIFRLSGLGATGT